MKTMKKHRWTKEQVKSARVPNYSKLYVVKPALLEILGNIKGKKILEVGCGGGFWLKILSKKGAKCTGIDKEKNQIKAAEKNNKEKIKYYLGDASRLSKIINNKFDIVLIEKVFLEVPNLYKIKKILKEAYKVTKKKGFVLVSELHPMAPNLDLPNLKIEKNYNYFKSGSRIKIISKKVDGGETIYIDYHWTFEDLCNAITEVGFKIVGVKEPDPSGEVVKKYPYLKYRKGKPLAIMIKAEK